MFKNNFDPILVLDATMDLKMDHVIRELRIDLYRTKSGPKFISYAYPTRTHIQRPPSHILLDQNLYRLVYMPSQSYI